MRFGVIEWGRRCKHNLLYKEKLATDFRPLQNFFAVTPFFNPPRCTLPLKSL